MNPETAQKLIEINRQFYAQFGAAFAATRRKAQPGIGRVLELLPQYTSAAGNWLDLGCGAGQVAAAWAYAGRKGSYLGVDFSEQLLAEARTAADVITAPGLLVGYESMDMDAASLQARFSPGSFDGILAFASLHHLPTDDFRRQLLQSIHTLLAPGGLFIHSEWQFQHSARLMERVQPWELVGLAAQDVDTNDFLLDWRYALPGQVEQIGLRYVHIYTREELARLAQETGFVIAFDFDSDGKEGNLALYQGWRSVG